MSDDRSVLASQLGTVEEAAARESRHEVLRELLGAYADRELPPETMAQIDAHLVGCGECRRALGVHATLGARLATEPIVAASPAFRARIAAAIDAAPAPVLAPAVDVAQADGARSARLAWLAVAGWAIAIVLAFVLLAEHAGLHPLRNETRHIAAPVASVPLLSGVAEDFARVSHGELPGRARDLSAVRAAVPFPIEPLHAPNLRLLAAWTAQVRGEPAAVLAYRLDDRLVVQYLFAEDAFFKHPAVRAAVADHHLLEAASGGRAIVAWPEASSTGTVLIGDVPPDWLHTIWRMESSR
jgi:hypothetical protein